MSWNLQDAGQSGLSTKMLVRFRNRRWTKIRQKLFCLASRHAVIQYCATQQAIVHDSAVVNVGTGGPPSLALNFSRTSCPIASASKSQSTRFVSMVGPSASVT